MSSPSGHLPSLPSSDHHVVPLTARDGRWCLCDGGGAMPACCLAAKPPVTGRVRGVTYGTALLAILPGKLARRGRHAASHAADLPLQAQKIFPRPLPGALSVLLPFADKPRSDSGKSSRARRRPVYPALRVARGARPTQEAFFSRGPRPPIAAGPRSSVS